MNHKNSEKKYQQAQNWWNSLIQEQKQFELKNIETEWIKKMGDNDFHGWVEGHGSRVEFKEGCLHCSPVDLSLVPIVFLESFGIEVYPRGFSSESGKKFPGYNEDLKEQEVELAKAKKNNLFSSPSQNNLYWPWIVGISVISLVILGLLILMVSKHKKVKK